MCGSGDEERGGGMMGGFGGSMGGVGSNSKVSGKRPINVKFEIPYFTTSGIQVRYLKIIEPKVRSPTHRNLTDKLTRRLLSCNTLRCRGYGTSHSPATLPSGYQTSLLKTGHGRDEDERGVTAFGVARRYPISHHVMRKRLSDVSGNCTLSGRHATTARDILWEAGPTPVLAPNSHPLACRPLPLPSAFPRLLPRRFWSRERRSYVPRELPLTTSLLPVSSSSFSS